MSGVDWSKAGKRLRHTPPTTAHGGRNPDWNFRARRWKDEADYVGDDLTIEQVVDAVSCMVCHARPKESCRDARGNSMADGPHHERRRHAAEKAIANGKA